MTTNADNNDVPSTALAAAARLNELLTADPDGTRRLFGMTVEVNAAVAGHPTFQVRAAGDDPFAESYAMGPLGLLNGLMPEGEVVVMRVDEDNLDEIVGFAAGRLRDGKVVGITDPSGEAA